MISIKSQREIELMRKAGEIVGNTHNYLKQYIKPGITTPTPSRIPKDIPIDTFNKSNPIFNNIHTRYTRDKQKGIAFIVISGGQSSNTES